MNKVARKENKPLVGISAARNAYLRLNPVKLKIAKKPQGSNDANSNWAKASFNWSKQLAICFDVLNPLKTLDPPLPPLLPQSDASTTAPILLPSTADDLPPQFDRRKLCTYVRHQVAYWDEMHPDCDLRNCHAVTAPQNNFVYRVPRNNDGKIDLRHGTIKNNNPTETKVKYSKEARLGLGVALVLLPDGTEEGRRCEPFDYTEKVVVSNADWNKLVQNEIQRVKNLTGDCHGHKGPWAVSKRDGKIYEDDNSNKIKGIGKNASSILATVGILKVKDLKKMQDEEIKRISKDTKGLGFKSLTWFVAQSRDSLPGCCPPTEDYTTHPNPYRSLFKDDWENKVSNSSTCNKSVSINKLIDHMIRETEKVFTGTVYEDKWYIYHDALSLMTSAAARGYMQEKGYLKKMILPQLGLNDGTRFAKCATGNQPGLMPLDAHLNQDLHSETDYHVLLSNSLPDDDKRKFSKRTPKKCAEAYKRIWDPSLGPDAGAPTSKRIKEDIDRVVDETYRKIFNARGCVIETGNTGRRAVKRDGAKRGGARIKNVQVQVESYEEWIHPDISFVSNDIYLKAKARAEASLHD